MAKPLTLEEVESGVAVCGLRVEQLNINCKRASRALSTSMTRLSCLKNWGRYWSIALPWRRMLPLVSFSLAEPAPSSSRQEAGFGWREVLNDFPLWKTRAKMALTLTGNRDDQITDQDRTGQAGYDVVVPTGMYRIGC